jgi:hypothetical protein
MTMLQILETLPPVGAAIALLGAAGIVFALASRGARIIRHRRHESHELDTLHTAVQEHRQATEAARLEMAAQVRQMRAELERVKSWASVRTGLASHQDAICRALQDLGGIADAVGRLEWIESNSLVDTERAAYAALRGIKLHLRALSVLNPEHYNIPESLLRSIENVWVQWGELTYELVRRGDPFRLMHPEERAFSESNYFELWLNFYGSVGELEAMLLQLPAAEFTRRAEPRYVYPFETTADQTEEPRAAVAR